MAGFGAASPFMIGAAGLVQGLGEGMLQGEQLKRQKALQDAYLKHQAAQDEMNRQFRESQELHARTAEATAPFTHLAQSPITAPAGISGYGEALKYAQDPKQYSFQVPGQPNYVMQPGPTGDIPQSLPYQETGTAGYQAMGRDVGAQAADLQKQYLETMFGQKKQLASAGLANRMFMSDYNAALRAKQSHEQSLASADRAMLIKLASGQVELPPGMDVQSFLAQLHMSLPSGPTLNIPGVESTPLTPEMPEAPAAPGVAPGAPSVPGTRGAPGFRAGRRAATAKQLEDVGQLDAAIASLDSLAKTAASPEAPYTGIGAETMYKLTKGLPAGLRENIPGAATPEKGAYYSQIISNKIQQLRTLFKGRVTNVDLLIGKEMEPDISESNDIIRNKMNAVSRRAHAIREALERRRVAGGYSSIEDMPPVEITPDEILGRVGPATSGSRPSGIPATPATPTQGTDPIEEMIRQRGGIRVR